MPYLRMMEPRGSMYSEKRMGPRMDPWGTPQVRGAGEEEAVPISTVKDLLCRYDLNHCNAVSVMPTSWLSREVSIL